MSLTLADITFLQSDEGIELLQNLAEQDLSQANLLTLITKLRESYTQAQIHAGVTTAQLRQQAIAKFADDAHYLFFTDDALQQASDPYIRHYRSQNVTGLRILDVCCGIGTDSIAFARAGAIVRGIDLDETRIAIANHNADKLNLDIEFAIADATQLSDLSEFDLIFFDPARRTADGKRIYDVQSYIPPLSLIQNWQVKRMMVKLSPGVTLEQLHPYDATVEFISMEGDLKEAILHLPKMDADYRATMIQSGQILHWDNDGEEADVDIAEPTGWLCEPDSSILRANLVQHLAQSLNGTMLDPTISYFCTQNHPESHWARAWKIREWMPFNLKKLRARLRQMDVGTLTVKKRGSPITPEELIRKLKLKGSQSATVILTRYDEMPIAIICDDILAV